MKKPILIPTNISHLIIKAIQNLIRNLDLPKKKPKLTLLYGKWMK
jgi:hypothetical protein